MKQSIKAGETLTVTHPIEIASGGTVFLTKDFSVVFKGLPPGSLEPTVREGEYVFTADKNRDEEMIKSLQTENTKLHGRLDGCEQSLARSVARGKVLGLEEALGACRRLVAIHRSEIEKSPPGAGAERLITQIQIEAYESLAAFLEERINVATR